MNFRVLIPQVISEPGMLYLQNRGYEIKHSRGLDEQTIMQDVADCDALLARNEAITARIMEAGEKLKVIAKHGVGLNNIDLAAAERLGIRVTNGPLSNVVSVAEHTLMMIMACAKKLPLFHEAARAGDYAIRDRVKGSELEGRTLGLVGTGNIGRLVAKKAIFGLDMAVIGYDPHLTEEKRSPDIEYCNDLKELLARADFVSIHVPAIPETVNLIDRQMLACMKPTAYLINTARGTVVHEEDLIEALNSKVIAGAALDVFREEPPDPSNPLLHMKNVVVTPHNAALTMQSTDRMGLHAAQGIDEVLSGRAVTWPVVKPVSII